MTPSELLDRRFFPTFERRLVAAPEGDVLTLVGGSGPPLLLLHGDPQTHLCWAHIAPALAETRTVVLADLRGRGESWRPGPSPDHRAYSKRAMAAELVAVMARLGFSRFAVVGHDRGARVARRMALDHPEIVTRLAALDIVPALDFYECANADIAQDYYYFFFLTQAHPMTENMIAGAAREFMLEILTGLGGAAAFDPEALEHYVASASRPEAINAMCECFRAGSTCDRADDAADRAAGRRIACPTLVMWGADGVAGRHFDFPEIWRGWADDVQFQSVPCGHFLPEEAPEETLAALAAFLGDASD